MSETTKACNLTAGEIEWLINYHGNYSINSIDYRLERMNYLNKRLKAFDEVEVKPVTLPQADASKTALENAGAPKGWGQSNG